MKNNITIGLFLIVIFFSSFYIPKVITSIYIRIAGNPYEYKETYNEDLSVTEAKKKAVSYSPDKTYFWKNTVLVKSIASGMTYIQTRDTLSRELMFRVDKN